MTAIPAGPCWSGHIHKYTGFKSANHLCRRRRKHTASGVHVEIGIYDKTVSPQTVVYHFEFNLDGEIIVQPLPVLPEESSEPDDSNGYDEPDDTDEDGAYDESNEADDSGQTEAANPDNKTTAVSSIKVNRTKVTLKKGRKFTIKVTKNPTSATDKITYSTSKKKIATVSKKGVITAKAKGTCKITVKCGNKKKTIKVTVK